MTLKAKFNMRCVNRSTLPNAMNEWHLVNFGKYYSIWEIELKESWIGRQDFKNVSFPFDGLFGLIAHIGFITTRNECFSRFFLTSNAEMDI